MKKTKTKFLTVCAAATVTALTALTGCSGSGGETAETVDNGSVTWAIAGENLENGHMDPHRSQLDVSFMVGRLVLDSLTYLDSEGNLQPWLAKKWQVSDDGKKVTFELRDDVTFQDGEKFNAAAVKANFEHIMDPATESASAKSLLGEDAFAGVKVVSEYTAEIEFKEPFAPFLTNSSSPALGMYSPRVLQDKAAELATGGPGVSVGSGPWKLTEMVPGSKLSYERNPDYSWYPEGVTAPAHPANHLDVAIVPDNQLRTAQVESNQAQVASEIAPGTQPGGDVTETATLQPGIAYSLYLNTTRPAVADTAVRQALELGIDRTAAAKAVCESSCKAAGSVFSPTTPLVDDITATKFDAAAAEKKLDSAGWKRSSDGKVRQKDGKPLELVWLSWTPRSPQQQAYADLLIDNWRKIGVTVKNEVVEPGEYNDRYASGDFDMTDWSFASPEPDVLRNHLHSDGFQNASHVSDPQIDKKLSAASASSDRDERTRLYTELAEWVNESAVIVPLYYPSEITFTNPKVTGLYYDGYSWPQFATVSEAK